MLSSYCEYYFILLRNLSYNNINVSSLPESGISELRSLVVL